MRRFVKSKNVLKRSVRFSNLDTGNICLNKDEFVNFASGTIDEVHVTDPIGKLITKLTYARVQRILNRGKYILVGYA